MGIRLPCLREPDWIGGIVSVFGCKSIVALGLAAALLAPPLAAQAPREWSPAQAQAVLDKTQTIRLAPSLAHLSPGERMAVAKLLEVGRIFQDVYEAQRHRNALTARAALARRTDPPGRRRGRPAPRRPRR